VPTFTLQTLKSFASASMAGFSVRHGEHQKAQKAAGRGSLAVMAVRVRQ
jgi:hypothetical protein